MLFRLVLCLLIVKEANCGRCWKARSVVDRTHADIENPHPRSTKQECNAQRRERDCMAQAGCTWEQCRKRPHATPQQCSHQGQQIECHTSNTEGSCSGGPRRQCCEWIDHHEKYQRFKLHDIEEYFDYGDQQRTQYLKPMTFIKLRYNEGSNRMNMGPLPVNNFFYNELLNDYKQDTYPWSLDDTPIVTSDTIVPQSAFNLMDQEAQRISALVALNTAHNVAGRIDPRLEIDIADPSGGGLSRISRWAFSHNYYRPYGATGLIAYMERGTYASVAFGQCSGTMISDTFVITAAHCVVNKGEPSLMFYNPFDMRFYPQYNGNWDNNRDWPPGDNYKKVKALYALYGFMTPNMQHKERYDLALIEVENPFGTKYPESKYQSAPDNIFITRTFSNRAITTGYPKEQKIYQLHNYMTTKNIPNGHMVVSPMFSKAHGDTELHQDYIKENKYRASPGQSGSSAMYWDPHRHEYMITAIASQAIYTNAGRTFDHTLWCRLSLIKVMQIKSILRYGANHVSPFQVAKYAYTDHYGDVYGDGDRYGDEYDKIRDIHYMDDMDDIQPMPYRNMQINSNEKLMLYLTSFIGLVMFCTCCLGLFCVASCILINMEEIQNYVYKNVNDHEHE